MPEFLNLEFLNRIPKLKAIPFFELAVRDEVPKFERWLEREIKRV